MCVPEQEPVAPGQLVWEQDRQEQLHRAVLLRRIRRDLERPSQGKMKAQFAWVTPALLSLFMVIIKLTEWVFSLQKRKSTLAKVGVTPQP